MSLAGKAVMINWSNVAEAGRPEYYEWHNREHVAGRVSIAGFKRGRRSIVVEGDRDFFNLYEVDDLSVLTSGEYSAKTNNPSPDTKRTGALITDAIRALAHVRYTAGIAQGGLIGTLRFSAGTNEAAMEAHLVEHVMPAIASTRDILGAHLCVADHAASSVVTADRRGRPTVVPEWVIILEGITAEGLKKAHNDFLTNDKLIAAGCKGPFVFGLYALQILISKL